MNILYIHNFHRSGAPSGDDVVVRKEIRLLKSRGHTVILHAKSNDEVERWTLARKLKLWMDIPYSRIAQRELGAILDDFVFDVIHIHNIFPLFSPSIYVTIGRYDVPFVHTLHDFRLLCANAFMFRDEKICEICPRNSPLHSIVHRCFQHSVLKSTSVAIMLRNFRKADFATMPDFFIVLTEFAEAKMAAYGFGLEYMKTKPNFIDQSIAAFSGDRNYIAFVGRLNYEKGIRVLVDSLRMDCCRTIPMKIVGDGPLLSYVHEKVRQYHLSEVEILGLKQHEDAIECIRKARFLVMPSLSYEGFPMVLVEAMAAGTPVIASDIGAFRYLINDRETGILTMPGSVEDLANKIRWLWENDDARNRLGINARKEYEMKYTPEKNYEMLMDIYNKAIERHKSKR